MYLERNEMWVARYQTQLDRTSQIVSEAGKNLEPTVPVKGHCQEGILFIPFWGFIVLIEVLTSSSAIGEGDASPSSV